MRVLVCACVCICDRCCGLVFVGCVAGYDCDVLVVVVLVRVLCVDGLLC